MPRSSWKVPAVKFELLKKVQNQKDSSKINVIKTWSRACSIVPSFVGSTFAVHNGKKFINVQIEEQMVGHKLGEFSQTRTFRSHSGSKKVTK